MLTRLRFAGIVSVIFVMSLLGAALAYANGGGESVQRPNLSGTQIPAGIPNRIGNQADGIDIPPNISVPINRKALGGVYQQLIPPMKAISTRPSATFQRDEMSGYNSWELFLITDPAWSEPKYQGMIDNLKATFLSFGQAIGGKNLALWFDLPEIGLSSSSGNIVYRAVPDINRSLDYADSFGLDPNKGPYIVFVNTNPGPGISADYPRGFPNPKTSSSVILQLPSKDPSVANDVISRFIVDIHNGKVKPPPMGQRRYYRKFSVFIAQLVSIEQHTFPAATAGLRLAGKFVSIVFGK